MHKAYKELLELKLSSDNNHRYSKAFEFKLKNLSDLRNVIFRTSILSEARHQLQMKYEKTE